MDWIEPMGKEASEMEEGNVMRGWRFFRTKTVGVFPYMEGVEVYRDGMLPYLYTKLKEENRLDATFCGAHKRMDEFVSYFERIKTLQVLAKIGVPEDPNRIVPVGLSWIDNPRGIDGARCAMPGEAFFGGASRESTARDLARLSLAYAFNDLRIDVMHGVQEVSNFAARNFSIRMGFKEVAVVPKYHFINGELVAARVMMLEAKDFMPKFWEWKENRDKEERDETQESLANSPCIAMAAAQ